ncbi:MAG: HD domain-containing protein [Planctomycetes bacterium]|nr:HD domain-containing protein [Planctomycetota bacterium]
MAKCPGQDQRYWKPEDICEFDCPKCGESMEFWKDEPKRKCPKCAETVWNPKIDLGCAKWCKYAEQCVGDLLKNRDAEVLSDKLIDDMKAVFGTDQKRIDHALAVLSYAEHIQRAEGGDLKIVKSAAILHDIGIHEAEAKHGSSAGKYQEMEGPPIAAEILKSHELEHETIDTVCLIIANHHSGRDVRINETVEFKVIWDADWLVNIADECPDADKGKLEDIIRKVLKTPKGRQLGVDKYL